jgi:WD40 repeat protein
MTNYYQVLGVPNNASDEQIRKIYRKLAQIYHPDTTVLDQEHAHEKFREINEAYEVLSDSEKREKHDRTLNIRTLDKPRSSSASYPSSPPPQGPPEPVLSTKKIDFGSLSVGRKCNKKFRVDNIGGPVTKMTLVKSEENGWFTVVEMKPFSNVRQYPMEIEVMVDTQYLTAGRKYDGWVEIDFDGEKARTDLVLEVTSAPIPKVTPTCLDFGHLEVGESRVLRFKVDNLGGPINQMIDFHPSEKDGWFKITGYDNISGSNTCPVEVEVTVNTKDMTDGRTYDGWIEISLDNNTTKIFLTATILTKPEPEVEINITPLQILQKHTEGVWSVAFSPDGNVLASGGDDGELWLWEKKNNWQPKEPKFWKWRQRFTLSSKSAVWSVAFNPSGNLLAYANWEKVMLREFNNDGGWKTTELNTEQMHHAHSVAFSPDGKLLAADGKLGEIWLWNVETRQEVNRLVGHTREILTIAFSPDGNVLASSSEDGTIRLWMAENGKEVSCLKGHTGAVRSIAFSPDGLLLASAGSLQFAGSTRKKDASIRLWELKTEQQLKQLKGHAKSVECVIFSPNGDMLVSSSVDNSIRFWDVKTGQEIQCLEDHTKSVGSLAFSPDGKILASGSWDKTIGLYQIEY